MFALIRLIVAGILFAQAIRWAWAGWRSRPLEGWDPVAGDRYGVRISPLSPAETSAARAVEKAIATEVGRRTVVGV